MHNNKSRKGRLGQAALRTGLDVSEHFLLDSGASYLIKCVSS